MSSALGRYGRRMGGKETRREPALTRGQKLGFGILVALGVVVVLVIALPVLGIEWVQWRHNTEAEDAAMSRVGADFEAVSGCTALALAALPDGSAGDDAVALLDDCVASRGTYARTDVIDATAEGSTATLTLSTTASAETGGGADWFAGRGSAGGCWRIVMDAAARIITTLEDVDCVVEMSHDTGVLALQGEHSALPAEVAAAQKGELTALDVTTGDRVWTGDILAEIDGLPVVAYIGPAPFSDAGAWTPDSDPRAAGAWTRTHAKQQMLVALGYNTEGVDGMYGHGTADAVAQFNADYGIPGDTLDESLLVWIGDLDRYGDRASDGAVVTSVEASIGDEVRGDTLVRLGVDAGPAS